MIEARNFEQMSIQVHPFPDTYSAAISFYWSFLYSVEEDSQEKFLEETE